MWASQHPISALYNEMALRIQCHVPNQAISTIKHFLIRSDGSLNSLNTATYYLKWGKRKAEGEEDDKAKGEKAAEAKGEGGDKAKGEEGDRKCARKTWDAGGNTQILDTTTSKCLPCAKVRQQVGNMHGLGSPKLHMLSHIPDIVGEHGLNLDLLLDWLIDCLIDLTFGHGTSGPYNDVKQKHCKHACHQD
jgi:hypothetical protein